MNYSNQMSTNQFNKTTVVLQFSYFEEIDSHEVQLIKNILDIKNVSNLILVGDISLQSLTNINLEYVKFKKSNKKLNKVQLYEFVQNEIVTENLLMLGDLKIISELIFENEVQLNNYFSYTNSKFDFVILAKSKNFKSILCDKSNNLKKCRFINSKYDFFSFVNLKETYEYELKSYYELSKIKNKIQNIKKIIGQKKFDSENCVYEDTYKEDNFDVDNKELILSLKKLEQIYTRISTKKSIN